jgi:hypothetical protein
MKIQMSKLFVIGVLAGFAMAAASTASASGITLYNATLVSPGTNPATPGWYDGTGNPNGGFTSVTDNGIEIALRAKQRQSPSVIASPDNVYHVPAGAQVGPPADPTKAWWNYDFSVDLRPLGVGTLTLANVAPFSTLTVQDLTKGTSATINFLNYWTDDSTWGSGGKTIETPANKSAVFAANWGAQNSQNPIFGGFPLTVFFGVPFDMNANDYYRFTMIVATADGTLATDSIDVAVGTVTAPLGIAAVPEPATMTLLATGLAGLYVRRRKQQNQSA